MNWTRGLLRLWLVATLIWIAAVGFALQVPNSLIEVTPRTPWTAWLRPMRLSDAIAEVEVAAVSETTTGGYGKDPTLDLDRVYQKAMQAGIAVPAKITVADIVLARIEALASYREAVANIHRFLLAGAGPPAALLLLGLAAAWIRRGFRRP